MRKSPGFDEGHWPLLLNECPWFCATCIGETFRSCMMQRSQKTTLCFRWKNFSNLRGIIKDFRKAFPADTLKVI